MWQAVSLQFHVMKYLLPLPYSFNPTSRMIVYSPGVTIKTAPWYIIASIALFLSTGFSGGFLLIELLSPSESGITLLQVISHSLISSVSCFNLLCTWGQLWFGQVASKIFNECTHIETQMTGEFISLAKIIFTKTPYIK